MAAVAGTAEDGLRCQQKIFEIVRGGRPNKRGAPSVRCRSASPS